LLFINMAEARYLSFASMNGAFSFSNDLSMGQAATHLAASSELRRAARMKVSGEVL
jgi:hypothetical protein